MHYTERILFFKEELDLIENENIREFVKECITQAPDYVFEDCPSSSSGKYHPLDELAPDGTIRHTKKVCTLAYELSRGMDCEDRRDEICAAALLHDLAKQGVHSTGHTIREHPQVMADFVADIYKEKFRDKISRESALMIYYCIFYHYGPWTEKSVRKPMPDYTQEELVVYLADYVSSKRFVTIDYRKKFGLAT
jgi:23S rRNA maturation-related 3'-5' exoribonuclease YhaM